MRKLRDQRPSTQLWTRQLMFSIQRSENLTTSMEVEGTTSIPQTGETGMLGDASVDLDVSKVTLSCDADVSGVWKRLSAEQKPGGVHLGEFLFSDSASPHSCSNPRGTVPKNSRRRPQRCSFHCCWQWQGTENTQASTWRMEMNMHCTHLHRSQLNF